jgi:hypothetical protein
LELFWQCGFLLFFFSFYYPFLLNPVFATRPLTSLPWYRHFIQIHDRSLPYRVYLVSCIPCVASFSY